jgi:hypothetical protein
LIPKFVSERAANAYELRNRTTRSHSPLVFIARNIPERQVCDLTHADGTKLAIFSRAMPRARTMRWEV